MRNDKGSGFVMVLWLAYLESHTGNRMGGVTNEETCSLLMLEKLPYLTSETQRSEMGIHGRIRRQAGHDCVYGSKES